MPVFERIKKVWQFLMFDTYGNIAVASMLVCLVSGVILAIPYDVKNAYDSVSIIVITNIPGTLFRNLHYWSAQFFLIFSLLHTWEHIRKYSVREVTAGVWFRLVISVLFLFYVMLSGFILKADADSLQARRILDSLINSIPLAGKFLSDVLLGPQDDFVLIYVHHIATATIFLVFILFEHAQTIWTGRNTFLITLAILTILSFFVHAPLHDNQSHILKGPWYFVGLQEILHWMPNPGRIWILVLLLFLFFYLLRHFSEKVSIRFAGFITLFSVIYLGLTITGFYFRGENWQWRIPFDSQASDLPVSLDVGFQRVQSRFAGITADEIPVVLDKREACMLCHEDVSGFSAAHDPEAIGCTSCHFGDPFTLDKDKAHKGMILIPGNLDNAKRTCGTISCHSGIPERIDNSLMTTNSGIVSVDRYVFREQKSPDLLSHIKDISFSPADKHLRDLCASCHLGNNRTETGPVDQMTRGGGCNACHLNYSKEAIEQHDLYLVNNKTEEFLPTLHAALNIKVTNNSCFGCHSRSGRISTNYQGWHETLLDEKDIVGQEKYRVNQDKRVYEFVSPDVHHQMGIDCIDCHNSYEVMGDGNLYAHEEDAVKISCEDCHFNKNPETVRYNNIDNESRKIFDLREFDHSDKPLVRVEETGIALINTFIDGNQGYMVGKNSGIVYELSKPVTECTNSYGHRDMSCSACHTAWAPQCIGCHNEFDPLSEGYDLLDNIFVTGEWVEYVGVYFAEPPTLGVRENDHREIQPAIPGMVLTIDQSNYDHESKMDSMIFARLFAPVSPHTTSKQVRDCKSCHNNPLALGYGRGKLVYHIEGDHGKWTFQPAYSPNKYDGLPEDAWIGFLMEDNSPVANRASEDAWVPLPSTRADFRPFSLSEQQSILSVGACLTCHEQDSEIIRNSLNIPFDQYLEKLSIKCILPAWE